MGSRELVACMLVVLLCSVLSADTAQKGRQRFLKQRPSVESLRQRLKETKQDKFHLRNLQDLQKIDDSDMPESLRIGVKYGHLLGKRAWEQRIIRAELELLYGLLLDHAEKHGGRLPKTLQDLGDVGELDLTEYEYYPVSATDELHRDVILAFPRELLVFLDGKTVYVSGGNGFSTLQVDAYQQLVREGKIYVPPCDVPPPDKSERPKMQLERGMWHIEPQLLVLRGDGWVAEVYKSTIDETLGQNNQYRASTGNPLIPLGPVRKMFEPYDDSIYDPYRWIGDPMRDRCGNKITSSVPSEPQPEDATAARSPRDVKPPWERGLVDPPLPWSRVQRLRQRGVGATDARVSPATPE